MLPFKNIVKVALMCLPQMINQIFQCSVGCSQFTVEIEYNQREEKRDERRFRVMEMVGGLARRQELHVLLQHRLRREFTWWGGR